MATAVYATHHSMATSQYGSEPAQQPPDEQYISTFFCRALYDYQTRDASSLSFRKNDIIEVLTQLESGWWDGLLGDERGWFPSNYVVVISEQEAEAALSVAPDYPSQSTLPDDSMLDMSQALSGSSRDANWFDEDAEYSAGQNSVQHINQDGPNGEVHHNDFWVPQVSQDGRIFYVNTQTGQHSREIPQEVDDSESDVAVLSPSNLRPGQATVPTLPSQPSILPPQDVSATAGFGLPRRSRTPEPWVRRLADDGLSYYYLNTANGQISWSPPSMEPDEAPPPAYSTTVPANGVNRTSSSSGTGTLLDQSDVISRLRSDSAVSSRSRDFNKLDRSSVYSDDSDVNPFQRNRTESTASTSRHANGYTPADSTQPLAPRTRSSLTSAEQIAQALQKALTSPLPESPIGLSDHVRETIDAVVEHLQRTGTSRNTEEAKELDFRVLGVVAAVRNLLYVTATPTGHIPSHLYPRSQDPRAGAHNQALQSHLKASHRKVAGTLSKLVLSSLATQYDPALSVADKPNRMESDAMELERSVAAFVVEVQRFREQNSSFRSLEAKRLRGVFATTNIGLGLPGSGIAGNWRGFGYVAAGNVPQPQKTLSSEAVTLLKLSAGTIETKIRGFMLVSQNLPQFADRFQSDGQNLLAHLAIFLNSLTDINVAQHTDIDGIQSTNQLQYMSTVEKARLMVRTLEASVQALFEDTASLLMAIGTHRLSSYTSEDEKVAQHERLDTVLIAIRANLNVVLGVLDALVVVGQDQSEVGQQNYRNSIEWRKSRIGILDGSFDTFTQSASYPEDVVDMELAFSKPGRPVQSMESSASTVYSSDPHHSQSSLDMSDGVDPVTPQEVSETGTFVASQRSPSLDSFVLEDETLEDETGPASAKSPPRAAKLIKLLGNDAPQHYITKLNADAKPWYLRPNYDQSEILIDPDGSVRAGTPAALIERLTAHEHGDPTFIKTFLTTFRSFMTLDDLFDLLVRRFWIQPPDNLGPAELDEWTKLKQHVIRMRVLNVFKTMVTDDDLLEKDDVYILDRMKQFAVIPEVHSFAAAKQLVILIERAQRHGDGPIKTTNTNHDPPPAPILPKSASKKLKLLDIDPTELARQLTLLESTLYKKIRPLECLQRSRESSKNGKSSDNITAIIQLSNRIANWVAEAILEREDSRKRAAIMKHFISVADRCRALHNFSTMASIVSGLTRPPIRRLKRTWEQVNARFMSLLGACESTIDTNRNFNTYRSMLATITPPCVPVIGLYLTTLIFINDGAEDKLAGQMINFRKRQKAAEVIQDIKRWQAKPYSFTSVQSVVNYLEDVLNKYVEGIDYATQFWDLSLLLEPREREDEKMTRLLQESGFL